MKKVFSKVLVSIIMVGVIVGTFSIGCVVENYRQSQQAMREQINQIRLSDGYIPKN